MDDDSGGCFFIAAIALMVYGLCWGGVYFVQHHTSAIVVTLQALLIAVVAVLALGVIGLIASALLGNWVAYHWRRFCLWLELEEQKQKERQRVHHTTHLLYLAARDLQHAINEIKKWSD
ncbi:hypothetical protein ACIPX0_38315 [Streptomyces sp. NPDC090075]|uniref:hypothetical protein n=1 Tax=Streptomyces sp. NPDC090075 TaxID=3365937 RepID=UPI0038087C2D